MRLNHNCNSFISTYADSEPVSPLQILFLHKKNRPKLIKHQCQTSTTRCFLQEQRLLKWRMEKYLYKSVISTCTTGCRLPEKKKKKRTLQPPLAKKNGSWLLFWMVCQLKQDDVIQQQRWPVSDVKWNTLRLYTERLKPRNIMVFMIIFHSLNRTMFLL